VFQSVDSSSRVPHDSDGASTLQKGNKKTNYNMSEASDHRPLCCATTSIHRNGLTSTIMSKPCSSFVESLRPGLVHTSRRYSADSNWRRSSRISGADVSSVIAAKSCIRCALCSPSSTSDRLTETRNTSTVQCRAKTDGKHRRQLSVEQNCERTSLPCLSGVRSRKLQVSGSHVEVDRQMMPGPVSHDQCQHRGRGCDLQPCDSIARRTRQSSNSPRHLQVSPDVSKIQRHLHLSSLVARKSSKLQRHLQLSSEVDRKSCKSQRHLQLSSGEACKSSKLQRHLQLSSEVDCKSGKSQKHLQLSSGEARKSGKSQKHLQLSSGEARKSVKLQRHLQLSSEVDCKSGKSQKHLQLSCEEARKSAKSQRHLQLSCEEARKSAKSQRHLQLSCEEASCGCQKAEDADHRPRPKHDDIAVPAKRRRLSRTATRNKIHQDVTDTGLQTVPCTTSTSESETMRSVLAGTSIKLPGRVGRRRAAATQPLVS